MGDQSPSGVQRDIAKLTDGLNTVIAQLNVTADVADEAKSAAVITKSLAIPTSAPKFATKVLDINTNKTYEFDPKTNVWTEVV